MSRQMRRGLKVVCPAGHVLLRASVASSGVRFEAIQHIGDHIRATATVSESGVMPVSCRCSSFVVDLAKVNAATRDRRGGAVEVGVVEA